MPVPARANCAKARNTLNAVKIKRLNALSNQITVMGMVLSAMPINDYDRRVVILTREKGKISAFARGARKPNSALLACSQPFSFGNFTILEGRSSYNLLSAEISNYFTELREDLDLVSYGMYFCEFADYFGREGMEAKEFLKLLYQSLRALCVKSIPNKLIRYIFEIRMMAVNGEAPQVFGCVKCNGEIQADKPYLFSERQGGLFCDLCKKHAVGGFMISPAAIYTTQYIIAAPIEKLYTFRVSDEVLNELEQIIKRYLPLYVDKQFQSLKMLEAFPI